jgi:hypothetical protein
VVSVTVSATHYADLTEVTQVSSPCDDKVNHMTMLRAGMKPGGLVSRVLSKECVSYSHIELCAELKEKYSIIVHLADTKVTE